MLEELIPFDKMKDPLPRDGYVLVSSRLIIVKLKEIKKHRCPNKITQRQIIPACT